VQDAIRERFDRLSALEKIREYFYDPNTGVPNERGFEALHAQHKDSAPVFAHFSVEGVKFTNDQFGHDQGQLLYRMASRALAAADANVCKVRGDFGSRVISAERANRIAEQATRNLPPEFRGFKITAKTGDTWEEASQAHAAAKELQEKLGVRAPRGARPKGIPAEWSPATAPFPSNAHDVPPHAALTKAYWRLDREQQLAAYRDPMTGLLSHTGMGAAARAGHKCLSIDVDGLKATDGFSSALGDEVIRRTGSMMRLLGGNELAAAHPHGDEFSGSHPDATILRTFAEQLETFLSTLTVLHTNVEQGRTFVQHGIGLSYGIGDTHEEAERHLAEHKAARTLAGERDRKGEFVLARGRLESRDATAAELPSRDRGRGSREHPELRDRDLESQHDRSRERGAHPSGRGGVSGRVEAEPSESRARPPGARGADAPRTPSGREQQRVAVPQGRGGASSPDAALRPETLDAPAFRGRSHQQAAGALWQSAVPKKLERIVIVERPVDALSHYQLKPDAKALYVSIGPALTRDQKTALGQLVQAHQERSRALGEPALEVVTAVSKSKEGATLAREVNELRPRETSYRRDVPSRGTHWHDTIVAREREQTRGRDAGRAPEGHSPRLSRQIGRR